MFFSLILQILSIQLCIVLLLISSVSHLLLPCCRFFIFFFLLLLLISFIIFYNLFNGIVLIFLFISDGYCLLRCCSYFDLLITVLFSVVSLKRKWIFQLIGSHKQSSDHFFSIKYFQLPGIFELNVSITGILGRIKIHNKEQRTKIWFI